MLLMLSFKKPLPNPRSGWKGDAGNRGLRDKIIVIIQARNSVAPDLV